MMGKVPIKHLLLFLVYISMQIAVPLHAAPFQGKVIETHTRWANNKNSIVTESTIRQADGSTVSVRQLGGTVDGIGMIVSHSLMLLQKGDQVMIDAQSKPSLAGKPTLHLREIQNIHRDSDVRFRSKQSIRRDFVQTTNKSDSPIYWKNGCVFLSTDSEGSSSIPEGTEFQVIDDVISHWQTKTSQCSHFKLINEQVEHQEVGLDGINVIKFRDTKWCRPATDGQEEECYSDKAAGLTTIFFIDNPDGENNGEILDADIELNAVNFAITINEQGQEGNCAADLANTLTHEIGHLLGLDHTCWVAGKRLADHQGRTVPACSLSTSQEIKDATMYNYQDCSETKKSSLEPDDIAGMCAIYSIDDHSQTCERIDLSTPGCCSIAGQNDQDDTKGSYLLLLLGLLTFLWYRKHHSQYVNTDM